MFLSGSIEVQRLEGWSLLSDAAGIDPTNVVHTDLDRLSGLWVDDPEFEQAVHYRL